MTPPIIVDNFGDTIVFETVRAAESYLEPVDVQNSEYVGYDSEGHALRFSLNSNTDHVVITAQEGAPTAVEALRKILIDLLTFATGSPRHQLEQMSVADLVTRSLAYKRKS
jgi:hypothetical protein